MLEIKQMLYRLENLKELSLQNANFDSLAVGTEVAYVEELLDEGPQAKRVSVGKHHA